MQHTQDFADIAIIADTVYDAPELTFIGDAADVILGMPGGGADGPFGMSEPPFEFEMDEPTQGWGNDRA